MRKIFLGKPLHWLLWVLIVAVFYLLGALRLHTRDFNLFIVILLAGTTAVVLLIVLLHKPGDRVTRDRFEDE